MRTQVVVVGAGPAGLLLARLLGQRGVDVVVLETRSREYVEARIRAGILEHSTLEVLDGAGLGDVVRRDGAEHRGVYLQWPGERHHLDFVDLVGRSVWLYGQTEVTRQLGLAHDAAGTQIAYEVADVELHDVDGERPSVTYTDRDGVRTRVEAVAVAGCDGSFGPSRPVVADAGGETWERTYDYSWLGILADVAPSTDELIYAWHDDGFALHSMRSASVSRLYLQVPAGTEIGQWSDDRIWDALSTRLGAGIDGWQLTPGPITEKSVLPMRSHVCAPMRRGRLFLAGDAAHIVPPTGAKGLNLAVADVALLAPALADLAAGDPAAGERYSERALRRVWRCTHFSWWMTTMLHRDDDPFTRQLQLSQLQWVTSSRAGAAGLAENYAGLPISL
ncbi:4-hydroxybenzoate 3-monooxygenase [Jatrophihabitans endophyticus]|uniref:4-hydroxybenzoate 3-monooxygenase n=1 Tax=Jatrophihabitans endophyticus TaxID=1206085 RepID=UPI0019DE5DA7|nr:4-hydroxybenzoate 3-monooxygenase [Jatrophihabitans endophyticus]MBE7188643.1 4-hydroxybenzoate 3-monooxygenase [Jatrophihabitans endophyticus]